MRRSFVLLVVVLGVSHAATTDNSYDISSKTGDTANQLELEDSNVEISKDIFSFSPPAEQSEDLGYSSVIPTTSKIHIKVIFIRYPEYPNLTNALRNLIKTNAEQKTIIYILNKQTDLGELAQKFHEINKPEVRFVKYRTPEEAETAVGTIQNQYASLGGATKIHGEDIAPVVEFTSHR